MTPSDDITVEEPQTKRPSIDMVKQRQTKNAVLITQQRQAAEQWQADNKKNALLFPQSYDFS